jgi:hypothetical protein
MMFRAWMEMAPLSLIVVYLPLLIISLTFIDYILNAGANVVNDRPALPAKER